MNASTIVNRPNDSPRASPTSPSAPSASANPCPARPVQRVARLRSPVRHQISAWAIWPPSSGNAGIRLNTSTSALTVATQLSHTSAGVARMLRAAGRHFGEVPSRRRQPGREGAGDDNRERHQRAGDRHAELHPRRARDLAHARQPAERPQVDAGHRQAVAPRDERVAELVQDHRGEERQHDGDRDQVGGRAARRRALRGSSGVVNMTNRNSTTNQLTPTPILIPKTRASWKFVRGIMLQW